MYLLWRVPVEARGHVAVWAHAVGRRAADAVCDASVRADVAWRDRLWDRLEMRLLDSACEEVAHPGLEPGTLRVAVRLSLDTEIAAADARQAREAVAQRLSAQAGLALPLARQDPAISDWVLDSWAVGQAVET